MRSTILCVMLMVMVRLPAQTLQSHVELLVDYGAKCERALRELDCRGGAAVVVKDDQVVFMDGFGIRDQDTGQPVDDRTLFATGSLTKGMVTAVLSMLVAEGRLAWDDAVSDHLPNFQLFDQWAGREMNVRDLICHRSGLRDHAGDLLFLSQDHAGMVERLPLLKPVSGFRTTFAYQNLMYLVAGELIKVVTGNSWAEEVENRILQPLGMSDTITDFAAVSDENNLALGHLRLADGWHTVDWKNQINFGAAGAVVSNVWDMAQWLRVLLRPGGAEGWPDWALQSLTRPQVFLPVNSWVNRLYRAAQFMGCGMGWFSYDYYGRRIIEHSGNLPGLSAKMAFVPEEELAVLVMCNQHESLLPHALLMTAIDAMLGVGEIDWIRRVARLDAASLPPAVADSAARKVVVGPLPRSAMGSYRHPIIGDIELLFEDDRPILRYGPAAVADVSHLGDEHYLLLWRQTIPRLIPGDLPMRLIHGSDGLVKGLKIETLATFGKL